jgi:hypothetical protein
MTEIILFGDDPGCTEIKNVHKWVAALAGKPPMPIISAIVIQEIDNGTRHGEVV